MASSSIDALIPSSSIDASSSIKASSSITASSSINASIQLPVVFDHQIGWYPCADDAFLEPPSNEDAYRALQAAVCALADGAALPCRGRDRIGLLGQQFSAWEYGVAIKYTSTDGDGLDGRALLFFLWDSGRTERFAVDVVNFDELVHFVDPSRPRAAHASPLLSAPTRPKLDGHVLILSHGWSPTVGPNYPVIRTLTWLAENAGWHVVVPSFVASYRMGSVRGRAERVNLVYQEMLCLQQRPPRSLVMCGHSQGGCVAALACTERVVRASNITGLLMIGSESPLEMDGMDWVPPVPRIQLVHSSNDAVISHNMIRQVAERWRAPLLMLDSRVAIGSPHYNGDDIGHDFLAKDLIEPLTAIFLSFLASCERPDPS